MLQPVFRKWWLILIQGILMIVLSIYILNNPVSVLASLSIWFGLLVLAAGLLGIFAWLSANKSGKENISLFWTIITAIFGLWLLFNLSATMKTLTTVFGLWMLVTGVHLVKSGWSLKKENAMGWIMVIAGILSAAASLMIFLNMDAGAIGISTLLGLQVLITGITLIMISFTKRAVMGIENDKLEAFHTGIRNKHTR
jgi:uncharacterized membrane protein HdeD (DUF308 family)